MIALPCKFLLTPGTFFFPFSLFCLTNGRTHGISKQSADLRGKYFKVARGSGERLLMFNNMAGLSLNQAFCCQYFNHSFFGLNRSYWRERLHRDSRTKCPFYLHFGRYVVPCYEVAEANKTETKNTKWRERKMKYPSTTKSLITKENKQRYIKA